MRTLREFLLFSTSARERIFEHAWVIHADLHIALQVSTDCSDDEGLSTSDRKELVLKVVLVDAFCFDQAENLLLGN